MPENNAPKTNKTISPDWLLRGVLTKVGDIFDNLTGRKWQPSSSLATSELAEKLKKLLDAEIEDLGEQGRFVPHNIKLKMQWDKFSSDSEQALKKLETELLTAAVDHINDHHYHTHAPLKLEVKTDYFTEGVKLSASFDKTDEDDLREAAVNVTVPDLQKELADALEQTTPAKLPEDETFAATFTVNNFEKTVRLNFQPGQRLSVGRTKENALALEDASVSKIHASLFVNSDKKLSVADTGSTNGTFINNERISYGKAYTLNEPDKIKFGTVEVKFEHIKILAPPEPELPENTNSFKVGEFEFLSSQQNIGAVENKENAETFKSDVSATEISPVYIENKTERQAVIDFDEKV